MADETYASVWSFVHSAASRFQADPQAGATDVSRGFDTRIVQVLGTNHRFTRRFDLVFTVVQKQEFERLGSNPFTPKRSATRGTGQAGTQRAAEHG